ncbi:hypothetical protein [Mesorhizobium sp. L48C026A00]|uniref:hypothetical protein n=1 Tax=Mesorhizobium sp. L48C026A00 TaxID=1287182 RepID=UPI0018DD5AC5|nr:hypothetical protein [Mesorhizobium sp. L48C026A00]
MPLLCGTRPALPLRAADDAAGTVWSGGCATVLDEASAGRARDEAAADGASGEAPDCASCFTSDRLPLGIAAFV